MDPQQRTAQTLRSMVPGTLGGRVNSAAPAPARAVRQGTAKQPTASAGGDSGHLGTGTHSIALGPPPSAAPSVYSTAIGYDSSAVTADSTALGGNADAEGLHATTVGSASAASGDDTVTVGYNSYADFGANKSVAIGAQVAVGFSAPRSVAIGYGASVSTADTGKIKVDSLEVEPSSGSGAPTSLILHDSSGGRWRISVTTGGALSVAAA